MPVGCQEIYLHPDGQVFAANDVLKFILDFQSVKR